MEVHKTVPKLSPIQRLIIEEMKAGKKLTAELCLDIRGNIAYLGGHLQGRRKTIQRATIHVLLREKVIEEVQRRKESKNGYHVEYRLAEQSLADKPMLHHNITTTGMYVAKLSRKEKS